MKHREITISRKREADKKNNKEKTEERKIIKNNNKINIIKYINKISIKRNTKISERKKPIEKIISLRL